MPGRIDEPSNLTGEKQDIVTNPIARMAIDLKVRKQSGQVINIEQN
jgi:hypothetical protein